MVVRVYLIALCCFLPCGTSEDSEKKATKFTKPCFNEDELLNYCTDPMESCHEEQGHEIKLLRLDGVEVNCILTVYVSNKFFNYLLRKRYGWVQFLKRQHSKFRCHNFCLWPDLKTIWENTLAGRILRIALYFVLTSKRFLLPSRESLVDFLED